VDLTIDGLVKLDRDIDDQSKKVGEQEAQLLTDLWCGGKKLRAAQHRRERQRELVKHRECPVQSCRVVMAELLRISHAVINTMRVTYLEKEPCMPVTNSSRGTAVNSIPLNCVVEDVQLLCKV
jgi:hypothetical protein